MTKLMRLVPALALVGVTGFLLGACGGGGGTGTVATRTGTAITRTGATATRETPTRTSSREAATSTLTTDGSTTETVTTQETVTTTTEVTTTAPGQTTTRPHIITTTETATTTVPVTVPPTTTAPESSSETPWGWIALGVGLGLAALALGLWALHRRRSGARAWGDQTADLNRRALVALDDVLARGSLVTGQIDALASEARSLEAGAPDDPSRAAAANVRGRLDELAATLESDRALRLASPPPTEEQLSYSGSLIRQQAEQLQGALRPLGSGRPGP